MQNNNTMANKSQLQISYTDYSAMDELDPEIRSMLNKSKEIAKNAYAPYSKFKVGAAVLLENGNVLGGNNQENRAFPSGLCAERVAIFYASANYPDSEIKAIGVFTNSEGFLSPCGSCRQAILEYELKQKNTLEVYLLNENGQVRKFDSISDLLPFGFKFNNFA